MQNNADMLESEIITKVYIIDYSNKLKIPDIWATTLAIYATALLLDLCICIYIPGYSKPVQVNESVCKTKIFLLNSNRNHFEVLEPNSFNYDEEMLSIDLKKVRKRKDNPKENIFQEKVTFFSDFDQVCPNLFVFPKDGKSIYQDIYYFLSTKVLPKFISDLTSEERLPN